MLDLQGLAHRLATKHAENAHPWSRNRSSARYSGVPWRCALYTRRSHAMGRQQTAHQWKSQSAHLLRRLSVFEPADHKLPVSACPPFSQQTAFLQKLFPAWEPPRAEENPCVICEEDYLQHKQVSAKLNARAREEKVRDDEWWRKSPAL